MKKRQYVIIPAILIIIAIVLITVFTISQKEEIQKMEIKSNFEHNSVIPTKYTCDGEDINPPLEVSNIPEGTASFVLIVDDPDAPAGTWVHWVVFNIPPNVKSIGENSVPKDSTQGINSFNKVDYGGPCPPSGTHRYFFKLYSLDNTIGLDSSATKADVESAMQGHILASAELIGLYSRG